jgi:cytochrome c oxidase subunit 3
MPATLAPPKIEKQSKSQIPPGGGIGQGGHGDDSHRWGPDGGGNQTSADTYRLGMWLALASVMMLFAGLTSAYVIRLGGSQDWRAIEIPRFLIPNSLLLLASSATLELFRRRLAATATRKARFWIAITVLLGAGFLAGQVAIWKALSAQGVYLSSNSYSSFFYLLTGCHAVHLSGGLVALVVLAGMAFRQIQTTRGQRILADVTAIYWHFMDGLWIYLFVLLFFWR